MPLLFLDEIARDASQGPFQVIARLSSVRFTADADEEVWCLRDGATAVEIIVPRHDLKVQIGNFYRIFAKVDEISGNLHAQLPPFELETDFDFEIFAACLTKHRNFMSQFCS